MSRDCRYLGDDLVAIRERDATTNLYTTRYQHNDALGSALVETDANRAVLTRTEYEPYGLSNRPTLDGPGYTGHVQDAATGLTYMQQRYYDPVIGRFLSVDPVTALGNPVSQFNRYRYAANNPYRFIDPDGRVDDDPRHRPGPLPSTRPLPPPPPPQPNRQSTPSTASFSPRKGGAREGTDNSGFSASGILVGKPSVEASGMAAAGVGLQVTKGLYNADSSVGIVTPAVGLAASLDVNILKLKYSGESAKTSPAEVKMGFDINAHAVLGGGVSLQYTPPSTFELSVDGGAGAGAGFRLFEVNYKFKED